jgi:hypothetical protein
MEFRRRAGEWELRPGPSDAGKSSVDLVSEVLDCLPWASPAGLTVFTQGDEQKVEPRNSRRAPCHCRRSTTGAISDSPTGGGFPVSAAAFR